MGNILYTPGTEDPTNLKKSLLTAHIIKTLKNNDELKKRACCIGSTKIFVRLPFFNPNTKELDDTVIGIDFSKDEYGNDIENWHKGFCNIDSKNYGYNENDQDEATGDFFTISDKGHRSITGDECTIFYEGEEDAAGNRSGGFCKSIQSNSSYYPNFRKSHKFSIEGEKQTFEEDGTQRIYLNNYSDCNCVNSDVIDDKYTPNDNLSRQLIQQLNNPYSIDSLCKYNRENLNVFRNKPNEPTPCITYQDFREFKAKVSNDSTAYFDFGSNTNCASVGPGGDTSAGDTSAGDTPDGDTPPGQQIPKTLIIGGIVVLILILFIMYELI